MARLYIANVSRQTQIVCYRLDYNKRGEDNIDRRFQPAKQQDIPPGRQVQIGGDFHMNQITDIVDQLAKYGLIGVIDVPRMGRNVAPYVYNIDKPVPADVMKRVRDHNHGALIAQGKDRRQKAAVATNEIVQDTVAKQFAENGIDATPVDRTDIAFEQEEQSEAGEKRIEEGFHVAPGGKPGKGSKGTRRGKN